MRRDRKGQTISRNAYIKHIKNVGWFIDNGVYVPVHVRGNIVPVRRRDEYYRKHMG